MPNDIQRPLLSICIPTYNGAQRLESTLFAVAPQVAALAGEVELIVSDNCSTDHTRDVVERARQWGPIRYHHNEQNVGQARNVLLCTNELATGEFAWVLGDDDVVRPGCVERVVKVIKEQPDIDYIFVNVIGISAAERNRFGRPVTGEDFPESLPAKAKDLNDRPVELWDELIDPDVDDVFLGALMVSVVRLSRFRQHQLKIGPGNETWASLEHAYALPTVLAHTMPGRKAYYIGYPCVLAFQGEQEWLGYYSIIILVRLQELLERYRMNGVADWRIEKCRSWLLSLSEAPLQNLLLNPECPGRPYFSFSQFIWWNRGHPRALASMFWNLTRVKASRKLPAQFYERLRAGKRAIRSLLGRNIHAKF